MELHSQRESEITLTVFPALNDLREVAVMIFIKRGSLPVFLHSYDRRIRNAKLHTASIYDHGQFMMEAWENRSPM